MRNAAGIPKRVEDSLGKHSCEATKRDSEAGVYVRLVNWKAEHRSTAVFRRASEERRTVDPVPSVGMPIDYHPPVEWALREPSSAQPANILISIPPRLVACWGASRWTVPIALHAARGPPLILLLQKGRIPRQCGKEKKEGPPSAFTPRRILVVRSSKSFARGALRGWLRGKTFQRRYQAARVHGVIAVP